MKLLRNLAIAVSVMPVFGNLSASVVHCHNPHHNHCVHHCHNHNHCHHSHGWFNRPSFGFSLSFGTPVYEPPVRIVERNYYRPTTRVVRTYSAPVCEERTYRTYGRPYSVCETQTVYTRPVSVYETVSLDFPFPIF
jgi:hypothetical protein